MKVLVVGGTGTVGSEVARRLLDKGAEVRVMSRSEDKLKSLPDGMEGVVGELTDPRTLHTPFEGVQSVFLAVPIGDDETRASINAVEAAKAHAVHRICYLSVANVEEGAHIPHFGSKIPVENAIKSSGIAYTILRPNNFYQNDQFFRNFILNGIYPQPLGDVGVNRVDVRDIADAAVNALTKTDHDGNIYSLHGPDAMTGESVAAVYSRHLGRSVQYTGNDLDAWAEGALQMLPAWMVEDYRVMYEFFQKYGMKATPADLAWQHKVVGHDPRAFDAYVAEVVDQWNGRKAAAA